jgi:steroid 5-alpha reductase family enzyme
MTTLHPVLVVLIGAVVVMTAVWLVSWRARNAGYVDAAWSYLVGASAIYYAAVGEGAWWPRATVAVLAAAWGLRLGTHLFVRVHGEAEDGRYAHMRRAIGENQGKWYAFFLFQAGLTALFSVPFWIVSRNPVDGVTPWLVAGVVIWLVAVLGEAVADAQLARFKRDPTNGGRVCDVGLWRYSRHPNYFFEWLHWFAYVALAVGAPLWGLTLLGPLLMLATLLFVTGIPFVEQQSLRSRGEAYRRYQRTTSMFVPWFPRKA